MSEKNAVVAGFPIDDNVTLRKSGEHDGLRYEISNHGRSEYNGYRGTWCYYVTIGEALLPPELFAEFWIDAEINEHASGWPRISYNYWNARFAGADWHGGVTYYEKLGGLDGAQRYVKIGCDFAHSWDEGREFDFDMVKREAIETVRQLQAMYKFYRLCPYFGTYHDPAEMLPHPKSGALYSVAGIAKMSEPA